MATSWIDACTPHSAVENHWILRGAVIGGGFDHIRNVMSRFLAAGRQKADQRDEDAHQDRS